MAILIISKFALLLSRLLYQIFNSRPNIVDMICSLQLQGVVCVVAASILDNQTYISALITGMG